MIKKNTFFCLLVVVLTSSFIRAQQNVYPVSVDNINTADVKPSNETPFTDKALGVEIWSDDFSSASNWTIDNDGQNGSDFGWSIDAVVDTWWSGGGITSSSGGGFAELSNGNPFINGTGNPGNQALDVTYTMTSLALDIPYLPNNVNYTDQVTLQYQESGARLNDLQLVQINYDGTNWVTIRNNEDYYPNFTTMGGSAYPNPSNVSINLAPYITSNASQVQIRFLWTTNFPDLASNPSVWSAYGWYIDDVKIFTNPDNDIQAQKPFWGTAGLNYSKIPKTQVAPIYFHANAFNAGLNVQNSVQLSVNVNSGTWNGLSQLAEISLGEYDSLVLSSEYTPSSNPATHSFTWNITQAEVDDVPSNNTIESESFEITDYIYAHDDDAIDGYRFNAGQEYEVGNFFDVWTDQIAYYIDVKLHDSTTIGSTVYGKIYSWDSTVISEYFEDHLVFEQQTDFHTVSPSNLNGVLSLPLLLPENLTANKQRYFVVLATNGDGGATKDVVCATSGQSPEGFSYFYADGEWFTQNATPIVRLNFNGFSTGLYESSEMLTELEVFPNPSNDFINVKYTLEKTSEVSMKITNMAGTTMKTITNELKNSGVQEEMIDISEFAPGTYFITILSCEKITQIKFCVSIL